jgi:hypothetical protein
MILTVITPTEKSLKEGYVVETKTYSNEKVEEAKKNVFNRTHEGWAEVGKIWLVNKSNLDDCVLLETWAHITGPNYNVVMEVGETE